MHTALGALAICALPAATGCSGSFEQVRAPFHASVATGPSPTVTITNIVGEVRVNPSHADAVDVAATKYASNQSELTNIDIVVRSMDGGVSVQTLYRNEHAGGVRYDITVPENASVRITNITGTIKVGPIGGSVVARTATGTVDVQLGRIATHRSVDLKSATGTIALHIAADSSANVSASSALGSISSDFPSIEAIRSNLVGSNAAGRIGDGAATVRLSVGTGSISIDRN
jgi:DUF4097 and DUF4098 domain-containing protein YvlB